MVVIDKVCTYLKVQPGDIMEWVESEDALKEKEMFEYRLIIGLLNNAGHSEE